MIGFSEPLRQAKAVAGRARRPSAQQLFRNAGVHLLTGRVIGAAHQNMGFTRHRHFLHHHHGWRLAPQGQQLALQLF